MKLGMKQGLRYTNVYKFIKQSDDFKWMFPMKRYFSPVWL